MKKKIALLWAMLLCTTSLAVADDTEIASLYFDKLLSPTGSYGRMPRPVSQFANKVTVVTMADIERLQANPIDDVLRYYTSMYNRHVIKVLLLGPAVWLPAHSLGIS